MRLLLAAALLTATAAAAQDRLPAPALQEQSPQAQTPQADPGPDIHALNAAARAAAAAKEQERDRRIKQIAGSVCTSCPGRGRASSELWENVRPPRCKGQQ